MLAVDTGYCPTYSVSESTGNDKNQQGEYFNLSNDAFIELALSTDFDYNFPKHKFTGSRKI